jgi:hypothetical protein
LSRHLALAGSLSDYQRNRIWLVCPVGRPRRNCGGRFCGKPKREYSCRFRWGLEERTRADKQDHRSLTISSKVTRT